MNKIKNFFKNNYLYIIFCVLFIIINTVLFRKAELNNNLRLVIYFVSIIVELSYIFIINKLKISIEKMFLVIAIPLGLLFMILLPIGQIPDENTHYERIYAISEGYLISKSDSEGTGYAYMPDYVLNNFNNGNIENFEYSNVTDNLFKKYDKKIVKKTFPNTSLYSFVVYIPQTVGVLVGKILHLPQLLTVYLARLFNFIVYVLLIYYSIKLIPFLKKAVMLIALLPISLQEGISLAPDALTISLSLLLVSYILHLRYSNSSKLNNKHFVVLIVLSTICSLCKIVYIPIVLLSLLIPNDKFKSKRDKYFKVLFILLICIVLNIGWTLFASRYLTALNPGVNSKEQVRFILSHPFEYIKIIFNTYKDSYIGLIYQAFGISLGVFSVYTYKIYPILSGIILLIICIFNRFKNILLNKKEKIIYLLISFSIIILITTSLYVQWTPLKNSVVNGIQGRYFIPILIFAPLIMMNDKNKKNLNIDEKMNRYYYSFIVFQLVNAVTMIVLHYM